ncbi:hypothetical protein EV359DRAFT_79313 [Lentinula novae-zelandiae]|nr:hypothetical protein EV359DRAFT_79313 [Lentinula novae-zelandiae]
MPKVPTNKNSFVNPASLSLPSTSDDMFSSPSPEPQPGPSRKRPRTEQSSEDRKEARAHRNRIAAQNSRDRRKAQFSYLERRVAELEEENRQLRAGMGMSPAVATPAPVLVSSAPIKSFSDEARDRENEELKERIRTLEKGWDAVVKALAERGLPTGVAPSSNIETVPSVVPPPALSTSVMPPSPSSSTTFSSSSVSTSPLPSTVTLSPTGGDRKNPPSFPAAGELALYDPYCDNTSAASHFEVPTGSQDAPPVDDATMESLFREIISDSESSPVTQTHSELVSLPTESHSTYGLAQPKEFHSQATSAEEEMTIGLLDRDRRMRVDGLSVVHLNEANGSTEVDGLDLGLNHGRIENHMMDLSDYIGESASSPESSAPWSDIGLTLEAFLDILPGAQDVNDDIPTTGLWESLEGRIGLV